MRPGRFRPGSEARRSPGRRRSVTRFNEARAFPPGVGKAQGLASHTGSRASMRPGRFRPGSPVKAEIEEWQILASMRPGRFRPGSGRSRTTFRSGRTSFNEARAFPPGVGAGAPGRRGRSRPRFNEARAFPPGVAAKRHRRSAGRKSFNEARAFPPGVGPCRPRPRAPRPGRRFNEARAFPPGVGPSGVWVASTPKVALQ